MISKPTKLTKLTKQEFHGACFASLVSFETFVKGFVDDTVWSLSADGQT